LNSSSPFPDNHSTSSDSVDIPPEVYEALISWSVKLNSGIASNDVMQQLLSWRAQNPLHEAAWQKLNKIEQHFDQFPITSKPIVTETFSIADQQKSALTTRRRRLKRLSLAAMIITATALLANQYTPWHQEAHYATGIGERETVILADGTQVMLNTNSEIDVNFSLFKREIILQRGEIYIETSKDKESLVGRRSFLVKFEQTALEAIGTKFSVNNQTSNTKLYVTEGIVEIQPNNYAPVRAYAYESYTMLEGTSAPIKINTTDQVMNMDPMAWIGGVLVVKQMRLDEFVTELSRYQDITIICDADVAHLKVSGVFQLNQEEPVGHALKAISRTLQVSIDKKNRAVIISKK
jgi:transmembrane sensor